jgi:hypothetical protein
MVGIEADPHDVTPLLHISDNLFMALLLDWEQMKWRLFFKYHRLTF